MASPIPNSTGWKPMWTKMKAVRAVKTRMVSNPITHALTDLRASLSSDVSSVNPKMRKTIQMLIVDTIFQPLTCTEQKA
jgi:hypothetical protein